MRSRKRQLRTKLYKYQKEGIRGIEEFNGRALLADEMGLGKTIQAIVWAWRAQAFPAVVVCPASLKINWQREIRQHLGLNAEVCNGRMPHTNGQLLGANRCRFTIINYDILEGWLDYLMDLEPATIILDEPHAIKSPEAQRSKNARILCSDADCVLALGGTPLVNRISELWNVLNLLRPDLFPSYIEFASRYMKRKRTFFGSVFKGARNVPELHKKLKKNVMIRRRKSEVLSQLPEKIRTVVPLPIRNRREYEQAETDIIGWLRKKSPTRAKNANRAKQLVRIGYLKRLAAKLKYKAICQWIDDFLLQEDDKLIVFAIHKAMLKAFSSRYEGRCVTVVGSTQNRMDKVDKFQRSNKCPLFFGNIQAAGIGWNLTKANAVAFAEMGWTPAEHDQGESRAYRIGQTRKVSVFYLVAVDTIEMTLAQIIQDKQGTLDGVLDGGTQHDSFDVFDLLVRSLTRKRTRR